MEWSHTLAVNRVLYRLKRIILVSFGLVFLTLGIVGYFVPGLPGTIWLILAASFFVRSSDKLYNFVIKNRFFGSRIREFLETGAMPRRAKVTSLLCIWVFSTLSVSFAPYNWLFDVLILSLAVAGTIYILSRPTSR